MVLMVRFEMLDKNEGHACVLGHVRKEVGEGLQATRGSADADYG